MGGEGEVDAEGIAKKRLSSSVFLKRSKPGELLRGIPIFCPEEEGDTWSQTVDKITL